MIIRCPNRLRQVHEPFSTKTLYKLVKQELIEKQKLSRKGKNNPKNHKETRGKINDCKTIHKRDERYLKASTKQEYRYFEGDTIVSKNHQSAIVTLVKKKSKYIVLLKASRKSQDIKNATLNWVNEQVELCHQTIKFDRGKEFSKWKELE